MVNLGSARIKYLKITQVLLTTALLWAAEEKSFWDYVQSPCPLSHRGIPLLPHFQHMGEPCDSWKSASTSSTPREESSGLHLESLRIFLCTVCRCREWTKGHCWLPFYLARVIRTFSSLYKKSQGLHRVYFLNKKSLPATPCEGLPDLALPTQSVVRASDCLSS